MGAALVAQMMARMQMQMRMIPIQTQQEKQRGWQGLFWCGGEL